jgi:hypothetical protein
MDGLEFVEIAEPPEPGTNQVLVGVEFSPINPNDLSVARGTYAFRPALPTVIGNEGVGRILSVGSGVKAVKAGDRVVVPLSSFAWRERMVIPAEGLFALPPGADPQQLAMLGINPPTAALLLSEFVSLNPGDWVLQNAANSGVGRWVIAFAKLRGLRTLNIVRRPELVSELKALGGDVAVLDSPDVGRQIKEALGQADVRLALGREWSCNGTVSGSPRDAWHCGRLFRHEQGTHRRKPPGCNLQIAHVAGFLHGTSGVYGQDSARYQTGGRDDRCRSATDPGGSYVSAQGNQGCVSACPARRKSASGRCRVSHPIHLALR